MTLACCIPWSSARTARDRADRLLPAAQLDRPLADRRHADARRRGAARHLDVQLERVYSAFIADHADTVARRGLIDTSTPTSDVDVVTLPARQ